MATSNMENMEAKFSLIFINNVIELNPTALCVLSKMSSSA